MPINPLQMNEIFASDLLGVQMNAATLNGLTANSFMRRDQTTFPTVDLTFDLGTPTRRWNNLYVAKINIIDPNTGNVVDIYEYMMQRNKHNDPIITDTFDLGSLAYRWRSIYAKQIFADVIFLKNPQTGEYISFTPSDLAAFLRYDKTNLPINHLAYDFGSPGQQWKSIYAGSIQTTTSVSTTFSGTNFSGTTFYASNKFVGNLEGTALRAQYADLAEKYTCKNLDIPMGTLISVADNEEYQVEVCNEPSKWLKVIGVVSECPGYLMNSELKNGLVVGLVGKVPVRVVGQVKSGDILIPSNLPGVATPLKYFSDAQYKMAIAIESNASEDEKLVMSIIK